MKVWWDDYFEVVRGNPCRAMEMKMSEAELEELCELLRGPNELTHDDRERIAEALEILMRIYDRI